MASAACQSARQRRQLQSQVDRHIERIGFAREPRAREGRYRSGWAVRACSAAVILWPSSVPIVLLACRLVALRQQIASFGNPHRANAAMIGQLQIYVYSF